MKTVIVFDTEDVDGMKLAVRKEKGGSVTRLLERLSLSKKFVSSRSILKKIFKTGRIELA